LWPGALPDLTNIYYHSLREWRPLFGQGLPILTYHKLGPRPARTRLKGLYLSEKLFSRQLSELKQAGFASISLNDWNLAPTDGRRRVSITFDDGFRNVLEHGIGPLADNGFQAIQFLVADRIGGQNDWEIAEGETPAALMNEQEVSAWLAGGHEIGSHTATHPWLTRVTVAKAREEIAGSRKKLEDQFGVPVKHFCYPYGDWNETVRDLVAAAGYQTACTTAPGVNTPADSAFALKRLTARYPSRNLKAIWSRLRGCA
jgi:peptidoglycan/xylan/chitin deacetylase (PgdA/CDA1 family)